MPRALRKQYHLKTYELNFPLKHPRFVMDDLAFDKERERQLGVRSRLQSLCRFIERGFLLLINGQFGKIGRSIKRIKEKSVEK